MKPNDTVTHVALPDRVLTVVYVVGPRMTTVCDSLTIVDTADNFRPYPPRKSLVDLSDDVTRAINNWNHTTTSNDADETRALITAAQAYLDRLEEQ